MLSERDIVAKVRHVTVTRLRVWVRQGWIRPASQAGPAADAPRAFTEADLARVALIRDLEDTLGFDEEQVPVLLNLIDQIHGLRAELKVLLEAYENLPEAARKRVKVQITKRKPRRR